MFAGLISNDSVPVVPFDTVDGWVLQDEQALVLAIECRGTTLFGWHRSDILGLSGGKIIHPDDRPVYREAQRAVRTGDGDDGRSIRIRCRTRSGQWLDVECRFAAVADQLGSEGRLTVASFRDVSQIIPRRAVRALANDLRRSFTAAPTSELAWTGCLEGVARSTRSSAALVWERSDAGWEVRHGLVIDADAAGERLLATRLGSLCADTGSALGHAWETGKVSTVSSHDVCSVPVGDRGGGVTSVLVPLQTDGSTHCVIELVGPIGDTDGVEVVVAALREITVAVHRRNVDRDLSVDELSFRLIFDEAAIGMCIVAIDGTFLAVNTALCAFLGYTADEMAGISFRELTFAADIAHDDAVIDGLLAGDLSASQFEKRFVHADGSIIWASLAVSLVRRDGDPLHFIAQITDIGDRKAGQIELTRAMATFRAAFDHSGIGMALVQLDGEAAGQVVNANSAFASITGSTREQIVSTSLRNVIHPADRDRIDQHLHAAQSAASLTQRDEFRIDESPEGAAWVRLVISPVRDRRSTDRVAVVQIEDITSERRAQDQLAHLALHDSLTGLPNRSLIMDRIHTAQQRSVRTGTRIGILFSDLDKFKHVNDSFGHEAGDQLLREVATRLTAELRPGDTAARLGGDEFVVLCEGLSADDDQAGAELEAIAERLHRSLRDPVMLDGREVFTSISIGMNVIDGPHEDARTLLSNADTAMYRAKSRGRSRSESYDAAVRMEAMDRLRLDTELHHAVDRDQLTVVYQPIVELPSGRVCGAEALLRWHHPDLGHVRPDHFIEVAEESSLIVDLGDFVISQVGRHLASHASDDFYVTANVSARQLSRSDFVGTVERCLDTNGLRPCQLSVELTENVLMDAAGSSLDQLNALRSLGVRVGVDDFGTGYASLTYLKQLPVSFVKIDRTFVNGLVDDPSDRTIANAVIQLASALDLDVIAEGVETTAQADILTELGCAFAQGYLFGRPAPPPAPAPTG